MIHVDRAGRLSEFDEFTKKNKTAGWEAFSNPTGKTHELYLKCREELLAQQKGLSAYTERYLRNKKLHIDHFRKRDLFPTLKFEWKNLIVDERDNHDYGAGHKDKVVTDVADYERLIDPVAEDPCDYLTYLMNGEIVPKRGLKESDRAKAEFTIRAFNLNAPSLQKRRSDLLADVTNCLSLSDTDIRRAFASQGFVTLVDYALENKRSLYNICAR